MIKKQGEKWLVDVQPGGRGFKRYRKLFDKKIDAVQFERKIQAKVQNNPRFVMPKKDTRRLSELVQVWFTHAGKYLSSGDDTYKRLLSAAQAMGDPIASALTPSHFTEYRALRLDLGLSPATLNRELQTFKSMFSELQRLDHWRVDCPFANVRLIRTHQPKMTFLTNEQILKLMHALREAESDAWLIAKVCLSTGARWGEVQALKSSDITRFLVHFHETKSKKSRSVPIDPVLYHELFAVLSVRQLTDSYSTFSRRLEETGIELPSGQRTHVLRHTFASHFMMNGGNILTLQKVLGHSSLEMTMRYAHLAPDYLEEVLEKNPASTLRRQQAKKKDLG